MEWIRENQVSDDRKKSDLESKVILCECGKQATFLSDERAYCPECSPFNKPGTYYANVQLLDDITRTT